MSRLISSQWSKHDGKKYFCSYCLHQFGKEQNWKDHVEYCKKFKCMKITFPEKEQL